MSNRLKYFGNKTFPGVMSFMYDLQELGFDKELDVALVMRKLWQALDFVWTRQGKTKGLYHVHAVSRPDPLHEFVLEVTVQDRENEAQIEVLRLFERGDSIAVATDVITARVVVDDKPIPPKITSLPVLPEKSVAWSDASAFFKNHERFSNTAVTAFEAICRALKPLDPHILHHIRLREKSNGVTVTFMVGGKPIQQISFKYNT
jgi:hypothetical protein